MIFNQELKEYFSTYNESEKLYRDLYYAKQNEDTLKAFLSHKSKKMQELIENWLLAEKGLILSEMTENLEGEDFCDNIIVTWHRRYVPVFTHKHTFFEIIYVFEGSIINAVENTDLFMKAGDICLIPPGVYHSIKETKDSIVINILLKHYVASSVLSNFFIQKNVLSSFFIQTLYMKKNNRYLLFHLGDNSSVHPIIEMLALEDFIKVYKDEHHNAVKECLLNLIFNYIVRFHEQDSEYDEIVLTDSQLIIEIQNYFESNIEEATLQSLAKHFNYSPSYLSRLIQQTTGTTFSKILRRIKINKACNLLHNTSLSVNEISEQIGYHCQRQFNRAFKEVTLITPSEYRKQHKISPL